MSRRRRNTPPDSLELLLDTICNTFGGVLFMAILIAMLIRTSSHRSYSEKPVTASAIRQVQRLQEDLAQTIERRNQLLKAIEQQQRFLANFATPDIQAGLSKLASLAGEKGKSLEASQKAVDDLAELESSIDQLNHQLQKLDADLADAKRRRESIQSEIKNQVAKRTQSIRLPKLRPSGKREVGMICRYGRLYIWHEYDQFGSRAGINLADMIILDDGFGSAEVAPKPFAGAPITEQAEVARRLHQFNPRTDYIAIIVYPDSFGEFADLKKSLVEAGFEYRLMPTAPGQKIQDRGGVGGVVQ